MLKVDVISIVKACIMRTEAMKATAAYWEREYTSAHVVPDTEFLNHICTYTRSLPWLSSLLMLAEFIIT